MKTLPSVYVEMVSDLICPWCHLAKFRLERVEAILQDKIRIEKRVLPYLLYPHIPKGGTPKSEFSKYSKPGMGKRLRAEAEQEGVRFNYKAIERIPNSLEAHRLLWLVTDDAQQYELAKILFKAYFEEGANIESTDILAAAAQNIGVAPDVVKSFVETNAGANEVDTCILELREEKFLNVVPTFILNRKHPITGLQSVEVLTKYIRRAARLG